MSDERVREAIQAARALLEERPDQARSTDVPVTVKLEGGLRCRAEGPGGAEIVTDMPSAAGGDASAPSPGWFSRLALASCTATVVAMRAAELGVELGELEVTVESESDSRGLLGGLETPARPLDVRIRVEVTGEGVDEAVLLDLRRWLEHHSPVGGTFRYEVPVTLEIGSGETTGP